MVDIGIHESLVDATNFVKMVEQHRHRKMVCLEEIAYLNTWITKEDILKVYEALKKRKINMDSIWRMCWMENIWGYCISQYICKIIDLTLHFYTFMRMRETSLGMIQRLGLNGQSLWENIEVLLLLKDIIWLMGQL